MARRITDQGLARICLAALCSGKSTEELISLVAAEQGMLDFCRRAVAGTPDTSGAAAALSKECEKSRLSFFSALQQLRTINGAFGQMSGDLHACYDVLGLTPDNDMDEVKRAYRRLSVLYHPDGRQGDTSCTEKFIAITAAYKAIEEHAKAPPAEQTPRWNYGSRARAVRRSRGDLEKKKRALILFSLLLGVLVLITLLVPVLYRRTLLATSMVALPAQDDTRITLDKSDDSEMRAEERIHDESIVTRAEPGVAPKQSNVKGAGEERAPVLDWKNDPEYSDNLPQWLLNRKKQTNEERGQNSPPLEGSVASLEQHPRHDEPLVQAVSHAEDALRITGPHIVAGAKKRAVGAVLPSTGGEPAMAASGSQKPTAENTSTKSGDLLMQTAVNREVQASESSRVTPKAWNDQAAVSQFLGEYIAAYESRQLDNFLALFTHDALENGMPVTRMRQKYIDLFTTAVRIELRIPSYSMENGQGQDVLRGAFQARIAYASGRNYALNGTIKLGLAERNQKIMVKNLDYTFDAIEESQAGE